MSGYTDDDWSYYETVIVTCRRPGCDWETGIDWSDLEHGAPEVFRAHWQAMHDTEEEQR